MTSHLQQTHVFVGNVRFAGTQNVNFFSLIRHFALLVECDSYVWSTNTVYRLWYRGALDRTEALLSGVQQSDKQVEKSQIFHTSGTCHLHLLRHNTTFTNFGTALFGSERRLSIDARGIWICALARIITTSLDASDVIPQPPPSTVLSRHVSGCHCAGRCHTAAPAKHRAQPSCQWLSPCSGHGRGAWWDAWRRRRRPGLSIVSWVRWEDNASRLDVLPIEGVLADGSRPCDTHGRTIAGVSTVSASQQWAVSCRGGGSYHCFITNTTLLIYFRHHLNTFLFQHSYLDEVNYLTLHRHGPRNNVCYLGHICITMTMMILTVWIWGTAAVRTPMTQNHNFNKYHCKTRSTHMYRL